jgi:hypothetical protein
MSSMSSADDPSTDSPLANAPLVTPIAPLTALQQAIPEVVPPNYVELRGKASTGPATYPLWGYDGELTMAFTLGEMGYDALLGPSGQGGKQVYEKGVDGLFVGKPKGKLEMIVPDNKSYGEPQPADDASALTKNLRVNMRRAQEEVRALPVSPERDFAFQKLGEVMDAIDGKGPWPDGVRVAITGAGGYLTGITKGLQKKFADATNNAVRVDGSPVLLEPILMATKIQIDDRIAQRKAAAANIENFKRSTTRAIEIPPQAAAQALASTPVVVTPGEWDNFAIAAVHTLDWAIKTTLQKLDQSGIITNAATRELKSQWPQIAQRLQTSTDQGALLIFDYLNDPGMEGFGTSEFRWLTASYGADAAEAYDRHAQELTVEQPLRPGQFHAKLYQWIGNDGKSQIFTPPQD